MLPYSTNLNHIVKNFNNRISHLKMLHIHSIEIFLLSPRAHFPLTTCCCIQQFEYTRRIERSLKIITSAYRSHMAAHTVKWKRLFRLLGAILLFHEFSNFPLSKSSRNFFSTIPKNWHKLIQCSSLVSGRMYQTRSNISF